MQIFDMYVQDMLERIEEEKKKDEAAPEKKGKGGKQKGKGPTQATKKQLKPMNLKQAL